MIIAFSNRENQFFRTPKICTKNIKYTFVRYFFVLSKQFSNLFTVNRVFLHTQMQWSNHWICSWSGSHCDSSTLTHQYCWKHWIISVNYSQCLEKEITNCLGSKHNLSCRTWSERWVFNNRLAVFLETPAKLIPLSSNRVGTLNNP